EPADDGMAYVSLYHSADVTSSIVGQAAARARALRAAGDPRTLRQIEADLVAAACTTGISVPTGSGTVDRNSTRDVDDAIEGAGNPDAAADHVIPDADKVTESADTATIGNPGDAGSIADRTAEDATDDADAGIGFETGDTVDGDPAGGDTVT